MFLISKDFYKVKETKEKGRGVFALREIGAGTIVGDYLGRIVLDEEVLVLEKKYGLYTLANSKLTSAFPSHPSVLGVHTINHSCSPNCFMYSIKNHVVYFALRRIFPGEELTVSYLLPPAKLDEIFQYPCYCKSPICRGSMHVSEEYFDRLDVFYRKKQGKYYAHPNVRVGEEMQFLDKYPKNIADNFLFPMFANLNKKAIKRDELKLPTKKILRELIREIGCKIIFPKLNICVFGVLEDVIFTTQIKD
ncbi:MAG: SET domain-containing protein [Candidatus Falkowbacteria bacterium]|nr:SET domain-containing protein [Candidatus Falkowbacteria bacterium]